MLITFSWKKLCPRFDLGLSFDFIRPSEQISLIGIQVFGQMRVRITEISALKKFTLISLSLFQYLFYQKIGLSIGYQLTFNT